MIVNVKKFGSYIYSKQFRLFQFIRSYPKERTSTFYIQISTFAPLYHLDSSWSTFTCANKQLLFFFLM